MNANHPMRVLLVEDNPLNQKNLCELIESLPGTILVGVAESEVQARAWLDENGGGWDLAVIDLFLSQGNGLNVLKACAGRDRRSQRVIVLSNYAQGHARVSAEGLGADAFFDKSMELDEFVVYCEARAHELEGE